MQFREFPEHLLGSRVKIKLLGHILSQETITSEREIAKLIGVSPAAVNKTLKEFHNLNLITPIRVGNATAWQLNKYSYAYEYIQNLSQNIKNNAQPLEDLKKAIKVFLDHPLNVKKVIIFGSIAERRELPNSDIDLFILVKSEESRKKIVTDVIDSMNATCLMNFGNKLNAHIFTLKDLESPKHKKFLEDVKKGIVVIEK